jgi:hypothetical protein
MYARVTARIFVTWIALYPSVRHGMSLAAPTTTQRPSEHV